MRNDINTEQYENNGMDSSNSSSPEDLSFGYIDDSALSVEHANATDFQTATPQSIQNKIADTNYTTPAYDRLTQFKGAAYAGLMSNWNVGHDIWEGARYGWDKYINQDQQQADDYLKSVEESRKQAKSMTDLPDSGGTNHYMVKGLGGFLGGLLDPAMLVTGGFGEAGAKVAMKGGLELLGKSSAETIGEKVLAGAAQHGLAGGLTGGLMGVEAAAFNPLNQDKITGEDVAYSSLNWAAVGGLMGGIGGVASHYFPGIKDYFGKGKQTEDDVSGPEEETDVEMNQTGAKKDTVSAQNAQEINNAASVSIDNGDAINTETSIYANQEDYKNNWTEEDQAHQDESYGVKLAEKEALEKDLEASVSEALAHPELETNINKLDLHTLEHSLANGGLIDTLTEHSPQLKDEIQLLKKQLRSSSYPSGTASKLRSILNKPDVLLRDDDINFHNAMKSHQKELEELEASPRASSEKSVHLNRRKVALKDHLENPTPNIFKEKHIPKILDIASKLDDVKYDLDMIDHQRTILDSPPSDANQAASALADATINGTNPAAGKYSSQQLENTLDESRPYNATKMSGEFEKDLKPRVEELKKQGALTDDDLADLDEVEGMKEKDTGNKTITEVMAKCILGISNG